MCTILIIKTKISCKGGMIHTSPPSYLSFARRVKKIQFLEVNINLKKLSSLYLYKSVEYGRLCLNNYLLLPKILTNKV